jgi:ABC-type multidrug transport system fused ATPase/permease subunit
MNNTTQKNAIKSHLFRDIMQGIKFIILSIVYGIVAYYFFSKPDLWSSNYIANFYIAFFYLILGFFGLMALPMFLMGIFQCWECIHALGDESKALLHMEKSERTKNELNRKSAIIGHAYAVVSKDSQLTEIWFTEDETGWNLMQKFGWMQYKRVKKPYPSSTHDIHLVARNVEFDAKLHKQFKDPFITDDERKLRREKYFRDTTTDYPFSIYAINYRLNKHLSTISVRHVDEEIYLARLVRDEFATVVKVCDKVKLSKAMTSSVYKIE